MKLYLHTWGSRSKPPLLLLHGMGGTGALYRPIAADLEDSYFVIAPDLRGHGESQAGLTGEEPFNPEAFGSDLVETLAPLALSPLAVIGHSMGVRAAVHFAEQAPAQVRALVLIDLNFAGLAGGGFGKRLRALLEVLPSDFATRADARDFMQVRSPERSVTQFLLAVMVPQGERWAFPFSAPALLKTMDAAEHHNLEPALRKIESAHTPTLVLRGETSTVWTHEEFLATQAKYPAFLFKEVSGAGHGLPFEKREEFIRLLRGFLDSA